jgi:hypothetical protein
VERQQRRCLLGRGGHDHRVERPAPLPFQHQPPLPAIVDQPLDQAIERHVVLMRQIGDQGIHPRHADIGIRPGGGPRCSDPRAAPSRPPAGEPRRGCGAELRAMIEPGLAQRRIDPPGGHAPARPTSLVEGAHFMAGPHQPGGAGQACKPAPMIPKCTVTLPARQPRPISDITSRRELASCKKQPSMRP